MASSQRVVKGPKPIYQIEGEKDVYITMRDGVRLAVDIFRPDAEGRFPALLPPDASHLPSGRATIHEIYRDKDHPSYLLLPIIPIKSE
jgi:predicted acyl esterase